MKRVSPREIEPVVRLVNYFRTTRQQCSWTNRTIVDPELILVVKGEFEYSTLADGQLLVRPGQVLHIEPGVRHTFRAAGPPGGGIISCIHFELLPNSSWASGDYRPDPRAKQVTDVEKKSIIYDLFQRAAESFAGYGRHRSEVVASLVKTIWLCLSEKWTEPAGDAVSSRTEAMIAYLRRHLCEPITRQDLARAFCITPEHVNYVFRKDLNTTPTEFLNRERMLLAHRLLQDERLSVKEAAARTGFSDPFYFSRVFKRFLWVSPSDV